MTARQKAKAAGEKYYDGKACKTCGGTKRLVSTTNCAHSGDNQHVEAQGGPEAVEAKKARERVENLTPEQHEAKKSREHVENLTPEQHEAKKARERVENLTPEQHEAKKARGRVENLTPEQHEAKKARGCEKYNTDLEWADAERARKCDYHRRQRGWYDEGGMATDEEMRRLNEFKFGL